MNEALDMRRDWLLFVLNNVIDSGDKDRMESAIAAIVFNLPDDADLLDDLTDSITTAIAR